MRTESYRKADREMDTQEKFMKEAIKQAKKAYALREVPLAV